MTPLKKVEQQTCETPRLFVEPGLLRSLLEGVVQEVVREEVDRFLGAGAYERSAERRGYRNGTKPRTMKTAVGKLRLEMPQVRPEQGRESFRTQVFERFQRSDKALIAAMQEMVIKGVSSRQVAAVMEEMGGFEVSAGTVSRAMADLDEEITRHFSRPLGDTEYPYLIVDARYEKIRKNGRVASQAALVVAGVRQDGRRELLSFLVGDSESAETWGEVFAGLRKRGLRGLELVVSDGHRGIQAAVGKHFQGALWQRCKVHFLRSLMGKVSYKELKELAGDLRSIYKSEEAGQCLQVAGEVAAKWEGRAPKMAAALREGVESTLTVWALPANRRRRLNSTNMLERIMKELKARSRKVGSFPNETACWRLLGAVLLEMQDKWDEERQTYIPMS